MAFWPKQTMMNGRQKWEKGNLSEPFLPELMCFGNNILYDLRRSTRPTYSVYQKADYVGDVLAYLNKNRPKVIVILPWVTLFHSNGENLTVDGRSRKVVKTLAITSD